MFLDENLFYYCNNHIDCYNFNINIQKVTGAYGGHFVSASGRFPSNTKIQQFGYLWQIEIYSEKKFGEEVQIS